MSAGGLAAPSSAAMKAIGESGVRDRAEASGGIDSEGKECSDWTAPHLLSPGFMCSSLAGYLRSEETKGNGGLLSSYLYNLPAKTHPYRLRTNPFLCQARAVWRQ